MVCASFTIAKSFPCRPRIIRHLALHGILLRIWGNNMNKLLEKYASGSWKSLSDDELLRLDQEIEELIKDPESASDEMKNIALKAHLASLRFQLQKMKQARELYRW